VDDNGNECIPSDDTPKTSAPSDDTPKTTAVATKKLKTTYYYPHNIPKPLLKELMHHNGGRYPIIQFTTDMGACRIFKCNQYTYITNPPGKGQSWMSWQKCDQLKKENGGVGELEACKGVMELSFENGIASQPWITKNHKC
jgi:hypothetical protein